MTGNNVVADTNIFIDLMKGDAVVAQKISLCNEAYLSPIVLAELYFGVYRSANPDKHLKKVGVAIAESKPLEIDSITAEIFINIKLALAAKGRPIPENDIWIAASAIQHNLAMLTTDKYFAEVDGIHLFQ